MQNYQVKTGSVEVRILLSKNSRVDVLEDFIEAELADTLGRVSEGGGGPSQEQVLGTSLLVGQLESIAQALVFLLVDLKPALDQIKRGDHGVGDTT